MTMTEDTKVIPFEIAPVKSGVVSTEATETPGSNSDGGKILEFGLAPRTAVTSRAGSPSVSVVVVTSDEEMRHGLAKQLDGSFGVELLAATDDPIMAVAFAQGMAPEVAIIGIDPVHESLWIKTAYAIREASPETGIVVIADDTETEYIEDKVSRDAGGWSYLLRQNVDNSDSLMRAIDGAAWGLVTVDPSVNDSGTVVLYGLTSAEQQTLRLMALGYADEAIAGRMSCDLDQVSEIQQTLYDKLAIEPNTGVDMRVRAVMTYHLAMRFAQSEPPTNEIA
jgi:adenylate cyclase